jgi:integrase
LPRLGSHVFTTSGPKPYAGQKRLKEILDRAAKVQGWVIHDIRRTASTGMSALGTPREIVKHVLNHAKAGLDRTYDLHEYRAEKQKALETWANHVATLLNDYRGKVVPFARGHLSKAS